MSGSNMQFYEGEEVRALIEQCLRGDQAAFAQLYAMHAPAIHRLCYSLLLSRHDAEDIMQEVFVYAFKNLRRFEPERAAFKTWLYTIAVSRCRNTYRRKRLLQVDLGQVFGLNLAAPHSETPEAVLAQHSAQELLAKALAELSPALREAVVLRYGHGLTYREIAEIMECPPKTAESRVRLAHDQLRWRLNHAGRGILEELLGI